jgi:hypothetical protein
MSEIVKEVDIMSDSLVQYLAYLRGKLFQILA